MDDEALIDTVESILGKGIEIVDCETKSSIKQEEILLINGIPVKLDDNNHDALQKLLVTGQIPSCSLINDILIKAGILNKSVQLETSLSVKSTIIEKEEIKIECNGQLLNEKLLEKKENNYYTSSCSEILEPYLNLNLLGKKNSDKNSSCRPATFVSPTTLSSNSNCSIDETDASLTSSSTLNSDFLINQFNTISVDSGHHDDTNLSTKESLSSSYYDLLCLSNNDSPVAANSQSNFYYFGEPQKFMPTIFGTVTTQNQTVNKQHSQPQNGKKSNVSPLTPELTSTECGTTVKSFEFTDQNSLVYRDGNLVSGSLQALIQHMVPTGLYYPDKSYLFAFLLSSRLFIKPYELLEQICLLCDKQQDLNNTLETSDDGSSGNKENLINFSNQFIQLLTEWMEIFPYDFRDDRIMQHVRYMTQKLIKINPKLSKECSKLLQNLLQRLKILDNYEEFLRKINLGELNLNNLIDTELLINSCNVVTNSCQNNSQSSTINYHSSQQFTSAGGGGGGVGSQIDQNSASLSSLSISTSTTSPTSNIFQNSINGIDLTELCPNPSYLAQQLTHIELERLYHIGPEEFVQAFAKDNPNVTTTIKDVKKTKNLEAYVQWFNRLSYLVASEIVRFSKKKQRIRLIEYWIETARECFNIGNFNSLMAIIAGLNMAPILRLKKTWAKIQSAKFSILEHQMDPSSNFNSYRSTLKAAMWRSAGATDERQRIVIPFFSLLVKDLYFLNEGCSSKLPNGHINFEKFWQLAKQVTEFITWKQVTCPFNKNLKIIMLLQTCNVLNENSLAMTSFECEPPDNNLEKDRYKTLKQEQHH